MQFNQRLNIKHSQSIVMTPQLRQAIKLLQFSNLELSNYIDEEIEKNPFLERKNNNDINRSEDTSLAKANESEQRWELPYKNNNTNFQYDDLSNIEDRVGETKKTLRIFLLDQILLEIPEGAERKVALLFLDIIEPTGWINFDIDEFLTKNNISKNITLNVLYKLQKLEPCGVFARDLGECLRIQLEDKKLLNQANIKLTENLSLLAKGEIK